MSSGDIPPAATTNVDGYAIRSSDLPGCYKVLTSTTHNLSDPLPQGYAFRINTGAQLPTGSDAVIMVEDTRLKDESGEEELEIETLCQVSSGENIRQAGSDLSSSDLVLERGSILRNGGEIGMLAFVGCREVRCHIPPHFFGVSYKAFAYRSKCSGAQRLLS
jgi:gephyrin